MSSVREAIILAGGLGTRLRDTISDLPKAMAPVAGRPFLFYVINYLRSEGIDKFIFSLGYKYEVIESYLAEQFPTLNYETVIEDKPLGTGGAILLACGKATEENILIANGDTLFETELDKMSAIHTANKPDITLALKPMKDFDRYGVVEIDANNKVTGFKEKNFCREGLINGGVYLLNRSAFLKNSWPVVFSFEKEFLESGKFNLAGSIQDGYFIDIGIPEDFNRAQTELKKPALDLSKIDSTWTLFLDRDGVINHEKKDDYIRNRDEFKFYDGVEDAFHQFSNKFGKVIIVSNQRGIGRGLMTEADLTDIHQKMKEDIEARKGRIDAIYYCTSTDNQHPDRKPNPGVAFRARKDHPGVDLSRSIIAGNKLSDMLFGRNAGLYTIFIASTNPDTPYPHPDIDLRFNSLADFAKAL